MTREDLKRQVLAKLDVPAEFSAMESARLDHWLKNYPVVFDFGPGAVLSAERQLRRELNQAQRLASNALRGASLKRP